MSLIYLGSIEPEKYFGKENWDLDAKTIRDKPPLWIIWSITWQCNFRCKYCIVWDNTSKPTEKWNKIIDYIEDLSKNHDIHLKLFGGEPTTHPHFFEILDRLEKIKGLRYNFFTNLGCSFEFLEKIMTYDIDNFQASLHYEKMNGDFWNKIYYVLDKLPKSKNFRLSVMLDKDHEDEVRRIYKELKSIEDNRLIVGLMPLYWKDWYREEDNENKHMFTTMTLIDENGRKNVGWNEARLMNLNFKGMRCAAGHLGFWIDEKGKVFYCLSHYELNNDKPIFDITKDHWKNEWNKSIICMWNKCDCEVAFPKWDNKYLKRLKKWK